MGNDPQRLLGIPRHNLIHMILTPKPVSHTQNFPGREWQARLHGATACAASVSNSMPRGERLVTRVGSQMRAAV